MTPRACDFFSWPDSLAGFAGYFSQDLPPWEWLSQIPLALSSLAPDPRPHFPSFVCHTGKVWVGQGVRFLGPCTIHGPVWLGEGTEVRPGAYLRGNVITGRDCVLGNSCEFKNSLLLDEVQVPHFSYVGDSVLGNRSHLGAGVICSNLRLDQMPVRVHTAEGSHHTGLRKLGAILADGAEVGCNAVLQPGAVLARRAKVYPLVSFRGFLAEDSVASQPGRNP